MQEISEIGGISGEILAGAFFTSFNLTFKIRAARFDPQILHFRSYSNGKIEG